MFSSFPTAHFARHSVPPQVVGGTSNAVDGVFGDAFLQLQVPALVQGGDLLVAFVGGHDSDAISPPGGWTTLFYDPFFFREGNDRSAGVYFRVAGPGDAGGSYTWNVNASDGFGGDAEAAGSMVAVRGANTRKTPAFSSDRTVSVSTTHSISVPTPVDQYAMFVTGWHGMDTSGNAPSTSSGDLTFVANTEDSLSSGGYTSMSIYYREIIHPSDPVVGTSVSVDYALTLDVDTYGVMLEGEFA